MAVLKKFRSRWWSQSQPPPTYPSPADPLIVRYSDPADAAYDLRPLTISQLDDCWRLDQRCFVNGEAYSRETFEYLLTAGESVSYRVVSHNGVMAGFVIGLVEPDHTGHIAIVHDQHVATRNCLDAKIIDFSNSPFATTAKNPKHGSRDRLFARRPGDASANCWRPVAAANI